MPISVNKIFKETIRHVMSHKLSWLKIGFAPLVLFMMGELITFIFLMVLGLGGIGIAEPGFWHLDAFIVATGLSLILGSSFYLNGYRYGVLNEGGESWWHLPFNRRLFKVIMYSLLIGFIPAILYTLFYFVMYMLILGAEIFWENIWIIAVGGVFFIFALYVSIRLSLLFSLIALERKNPLRMSWKMTRGNVIYLGSLMLLIGLIIAGIFFLLALLISTIMSMIVPFSTILTLLWAKMIFFLIGLPIVGLPLGGLISFFGNAFFGATTAMGGVTPFYTFFILNSLLLPPIFLITWALFTKALSLVYLSLTKNSVSH